MFGFSGLKMVISEDLTASTADTVKAVVWITASFSVVFVALRIYVRVILKKAFGIDDAMVLIATVRKPSIND